MADEPNPGNPIPSPTPEAPQAPPGMTPAAAEPTLLAAEPVAYGEFKLPDGVTLDGEQMTAATDLFREAGLPQEQAQKFIDLALSRERAMAERSLQAFVEVQNQWVSEIKADPDIGGPRLQSSLAAAARAIDRLAVPGLKDALNLTGAGNNPAVVKAFVRIGQLMSEDRFAPGHPPAPSAPRSAAEIIYDGGPRGSVDGM